jgi:hypothetical protein
MPSIMRRRTVFRKGEVVPLWVEERTADAGSARAFTIA